MDLRAIYSSILSLLLFTTPLGYANPTFLAAEQAFQFSAESISTQKVKLNWEIEPHYYLYHDQFKVLAPHPTESHQPVVFKLPKGKIKDDPTFGKTEVHYDQVSTEINVQPNSKYQVIWQGCSQDGLCYPLQKTVITTDADGLVPQNLKQAKNSNLSNSAFPNQNLQLNQIVNQNSTTLNSNVHNANFDQNNVVQDIQEPQNNSVHGDLSNTTSLQWNDDQSFFSLLSADSIWLNLIVFFGLGLLLAFLPCSLPLIPIISALIVQRRSGYRAAVIALSFILSMATVYGLMGIFVAELGFSFQRWFQSPWVVSFFAVMFVVFALNLFGLFQLALPQSWINQLNQYQEQQKAGTILGSISMGALSALIVGPCMSAPLAGALLFVSQSHDASIGGLYLFILGLGIGFPLFIACVFGSKLLPKPGVWMNHLKVLFGFLMLGLAVYFIRPMISSEYYHYALALITFITALYLLKILFTRNTLMTQIAIAVLGLSTLYFSYANIIQALAVDKIEHTQGELRAWTRVSTFEEFEQALKQAKQLNQPVIVDVYADWCVACQPIETEVFPRKDVQNILADYALIKLDLTKQNDSQALILKKHEILGPPTLLILDAQSQEIRNLRLTGTFKAETLIRHLQRFKSDQNEKN